MNIVQRFYFDTSVIGGVYDTEFEEHSTILMEKVKLGLIKAVISNVTEREIMKARKEVRDFYTSLPKQCIELIERIMKAKEKKVIKNYDAVKEMRKIRDKISAEIAGMNAEQIIAYFKESHLQRAK